MGEFGFLGAGFGFERNVMEGITSRRQNITEFGDLMLHMSDG